MSRWNEQSKSHAFQASWAALKASLEQAELNEDSSSDEFKELARLKKVITYLGVILDATDPEFIPLGKWDEFNPQAAACSNERRKVLERARPRSATAWFAPFGLMQGVV